jgi:hypothetical protein
VRNKADAGRNILLEPQLVPRASTAAAKPSPNSN